MKNSHIGFIGLGVMGEPMAGHLADAGYKICAHDIDPVCIERFAARHNSVQIMESPREIAAVADIVITMLPSGSYVQEVALGDTGLIHGFGRGACLLDTSSCEPWLTVETAAALAARGISMVDAPVSGARPGAEKAELVFMAGGDDASIANISPLLDIMGKKTFHLGQVGAGHAMKCINNLVTSITFMATAEGLTIGKKFGLDPEVMTDVLNVSTGMSWISKTHIKQRITNRKFDDAFKLGLMAKDIGIAMKLAQDLKLSLQLSGQNRQLWQEAVQYAGNDSSISEMVRWLENITGIEISAGISDS